jgi:phosphate-selective porin OprO/OprP
MKKINTLLVLALFGAGAHGAAADKDLLDILLKNGSINKTQYNSMAGKEGLATSELVETLSKNGTITKEQYTKLTTKNPSLAAQTAVLKSPNEAQVELSDKGLEFKTADGNFSAKIGGRLQVDSQINFNDAANSNRPGNQYNPNLNPSLNDGVGVRRARLETEGVMFRDFKYRFEYDFVRAPNGAPVGAGITDAFMQWAPSSYDAGTGKYSSMGFGVTIGQFKEPFGLESYGSNRYLTFLERNLATNAFVEGANPYRLGASAEIWDNAKTKIKVGDKEKDVASGRYTGRVTFQTESIGATGGTGNNVSTPSGTTTNGNANRNGVGAGDTSWSPVARVSGLPYFAVQPDGNGADLVHLGLAGSYTATNNKYSYGATNIVNGLTTNPMSFSTGPNTNYDRSAFINTGALTLVNATTGAKIRELTNFERIGAELAGVYGPFSLQMEYMGTWLGGTGYSSSDYLQGGYVFGSYFLTGESRQYDTKKGTFGRQFVKHKFDPWGKETGWGAWEIAYKYDVLDLRTPNTNCTGTTAANAVCLGGGKLETGVLAINWYLNNHVRFMTDWVHVLTSNNNNTASATSNNIGKYNGVTPDIVEFRTQIDW